ncbi:MAG: hypothetical protein JWO30_4824 [Fibrobacteres bacterium]|nr:hypothetical protein [Fibrobacterota bacterium]
MLRWAAMAWMIASIAGVSLSAGAAPVRAEVAPARAAAAQKQSASADSSVLRFIPPVLTHLDTLFIIAATGEPRFKPMRDSAEKELIAGDTSTLDYLISKRLLNQTPRQRHYVESLFKSVSDSGRNHAPVTKLAAALSGAADSVQVQLLHIGSELGDTTFLPVARLYLRADSVEVRKTAARSLGSYPSPGNIALLLDGLDKTRDLELQARLWALDKQTGFKDWPRLLPVLEDENLYNRQLARRIVAKAAGDWVPLERYIQAELDPEEQLEWVLLALEVPGPAAKAYVRKALPALDPEPRKFIESIMPRPMRNLRMPPVPEPPR